MQSHKMKKMTELPIDILNMIFILLATSTNGARALVRISKTCKALRELAGQTSVLRVVSFQGLTDDYRKHLHPRDLIFQCARVGNQAAECILGKAFLSDSAFRRVILLDDQPARDENGSYVSAPLQDPRLVRSFIRLGSSKDMNNLIYIALKSYLFYFMVFEKSSSIEMVAVWSKFLYELRRFCDTTVVLGSPSPNNLLAQVMPPHDIAHREEAIVLFDKLFPPQEKGERAARVLSRTWVSSPKPTKRQKKSTGKCVGPTRASSKVVGNVTARTKRRGHILAESIWLEHVLSESHLLSSPVDSNVVV